MRAFLALAVASTIAAGPASAGVVYSNNFDAENGGSEAPNYTGFNGLTVVGGTVDLVGPGMGIACVTGRCVDLDGSTNSGGQIETSQFYGFKAGDLVTFSFDLSGNQRNAGQDPFVAGFRFSSFTGLTSFNAGGAFGDVSAENVPPLLVTQYRGTADANDPFATFSLSFRPANDGSFAAYLGSGSADGIGPVLDNFTVSVDPSAAPEPASWALMLGGFGIVGAAMRRRQRTVVRFA